MRIPEYCSSPLKATLTLTVTRTLYGKVWINNNHLYHTQNKYQCIMEEMKK